MAQRYALLDASTPQKVVQINLNSTTGFVAFDDDAVACGFETSDGGVTFSAPTVTLTWDNIRDKQTSMIESVRWKVERIITQKELGLAEVDRALTDAQYTDYLQYLQDIRDCDEDNHATPDLADTALDALVKPTH